jgi:amino acid transporter
VLRAGFGPFGIAGTLVTLAILASLVMRVSQISVAFTAVTRLPMVAGWDRLLPAWFSRLHPKYRTPVNSIVVVAVFSFAASVVSLVGVGQAEAFQLMFNASGIFYALTYVVLFAIPLVGLRGVTPRPSPWIRLASWSGLLMTLLYVILSVFPIIQVTSVWSFALKIIAVTVLMNVVGVGILVAARRRPNAAMAKGA